MAEIGSGRDIDPHALKVLVMSGNYIFLENFRLCLLVISESSR